MSYSIYDHGYNDNSLEYNVLEAGEEDKPQLIYLQRNKFGFWKILYDSIQNTDNQFASLVWMNTAGFRKFTRQDDLLSNYNLNGKNRNEIIQLLGNPTETKYFNESNNIVYYLGDERGFIRIDSEWLVVWFDPQNKVAKYAIMTD